MFHHHHGIGAALLGLAQGGVDLFGPEAMVIRERGVVLVPGLSPIGNERFRVGDSLLLKHDTWALLHELRRERVSLYCLDFDSVSRSERIDVLDASTQLVEQRSRPGHVAGIARLVVAPGAMTVLAENAGKAMSRDELQQRVWNVPYRARDRSVDVCVRKLRQKLERVSPDWRFIHTHFGFGYRF